MNTQTRETTAVRVSYGASATCCVALACAACIYAALDPATTARANLDACLHERLSQHGDAANAAASGVIAHGARAASRDEREQALSAALYACSTQP
ncbi:hypothetical protein [Paraburkholderia bryophila]|jgi:hypothetical protein|uniref:Lipoprotein n=1 Tax=Paraburkholderia bryophila TaxID=420952 RepID=A0A329CCP2_9BURK|nr:hypothetical protein [Paraburkholderia bryophila]RAS28825.1 hypothetical protein BX591_111104 [Paraburkholderia bryophila]